MIFKKLYLFFLFLFFVTSLLTLNQFLPQHEEGKKEVREESYNEKLTRLNSMDKISEYLDKETIQKGLEINTKEYVDLAFNIATQRFYRGYAQYNIRDNYIAFFAGKYIWEDFLGIVIPDDILKHNDVLCSQQVIVFMGLLKNKGYKVRSVLLNRHFCAEVFYDDSWHFYDPYIDPDFSQKISRPSVKELVNNKDLLYYSYRGKLSKVLIDSIFSEYRLGKINSYPAKNMSFFHYLTKFLSDWLWLLLLCLAIYFKGRWKKDFRKKENI